MTLPLATTTISVTRNTTAQTQDPYDSTPEITDVASGVRAVISPPAGTAKLVGGDRVVYNAALRCDPLALLPGDQVTDAQTGNVWTVISASPISAVGLAFTLAQVRLVTGAA